MEHIKTNHKELAMLNSLFSQQTLFCEAFQVFKQDIGEILSNLVQGQTSMNSELLLLKEGLNNKINKKESNVNGNNSEKDNYAKKAAANNAEEPSKKKKTGNTDTIKSTASSLPAQVVWVGDSHSNSLDKRAFEDLTNTKVDMAIVYTVDKDNDAKYPDRNFMRIVPEKLAKKKYDTLILQGGCNEISNVIVDSHFKPEDVKSWEEKVRLSRTKMFNIALESLEKNTDLKKVIIVTSPPRYDPEDPNGIKAKLNHFGNSIYTSLWMQKGCPGNISIQDQKLDCQGELRGKRFGNPVPHILNGKPFDGIHLRGKLGSRHYTNSMARIFANCFPGIQINWRANQSRDSNYHNSCAQTNYQQGQSDSSQPRRPINGNYKQRNVGQNYNSWNGNYETDFSHQPHARQSRGFKRNNVGQKTYVQKKGGKDMYNIPVSNRFQGNC